MRVIIGKQEMVSIEDIILRQQLLSSLLREKRAVQKSSLL